jgi:predicted transcriptional regulator
MGLPKFITDRYTTGGNANWGNIGKDALMASAVYAAINPNDSDTISNFMGTNQQGPVGYMGGIPNYTASRELLPSAFAPTYADPITQEVTARRPGSAGRRYFTDTTFTEDAVEPIMGKTAVELAAENQQNIDNQATYESIMGNVFDTRVATEAADAEAALADTTGADTVTDTVTAGTGAATDPTGADTVTDTATDIINTPTAEEAFATFMSQFSGDLTAADAAILSGSGYTASQIATSLGSTAADVQTFLDYYANLGTVDDTVVDDTVVDDTVEAVLLGMGWTANADGTFTDLKGVVYNKNAQGGYSPDTATDIINTPTAEEAFATFMSQFSGDLTAADAAILSGSGYTASQIATSLGSTAADVQTFLDYYANLGTVDDTVVDDTVVDGSEVDPQNWSSARLKQAVLDGSMDYNAAYKALGVADAVNPFGFTDTEQMALGIHESQRTGQGYKYNSTTGSTDLYDYDAGEWVDDGNHSAGAADIINTPTAEEAFATFMSQFSGDLTAADAAILSGSGYTASQIATSLGSTAADVQTFLDYYANLGTVDDTVTGLPTHINPQIMTNYNTAVTGDGDPAYSDTEIDAVVQALTSGQRNIADVAQDFGESQLDVITELLIGGYQTPAEITATLNAVDPDTEFTEVDLVLQLLKAGKANFADVAAYYQDQYPGVTAAEVEAYYNNTTFAQGGNVNGYYLGGPTDGMADQIPATIDNSQPAALSDGEFVIPADIVSHLGNGNSEAGADSLYSMMERVRTDRTGNPNQGRQIDPNEYLA